MAPRNDRFFEILESMVDIPNRYRDIQPAYPPDDPYPSAEPSEHKWYKEFDLSDDERLQDYVKRRLQRFPEDLEKNNQLLNKSLDVMMDKDMPLDKRVETLLDFFAMKKLGHAADPGLLGGYSGMVRDPDEPREYYDLDYIKSLWNRE